MSKTVFAILDARHKKRFLSMISPSREGKDEFDIRINDSLSIT
jgi:hypothetical protein